VRRRRTKAGGTRRELRRSTTTPLSTEEGGKPFANNDKRNAHKGKGKRKGKRKGKGEGGGGESAPPFVIGSSDSLSLLYAPHPNITYGRKFIIFFDLFLNIIVNNEEEGEGGGGGGGGGTVDLSTERVDRHEDVTLKHKRLSNDGKRTMRNAYIRYICVGKN